MIKTDFENRYFKRLKRDLGISEYPNEIIYATIDRLLTPKHDSKIVHDFYLHYVSGEPTYRIADQFDCNRATVNAHIPSIVKELRLLGIQDAVMAYANQNITRIPRHVTCRLIPMNQMVYRWIKKQFPNKNEYKITMGNIIALHKKTNGFQIIPETNKRSERLISDTIRETLIKGLKDCYPNRTWETDVKETIEECMKQYPCNLLCEIFSINKTDAKYVLSMEQKQVFSDLLEKALTRTDFTERERQIINMVYKQGHSMKRCGEKLSVTGTRISQIINCSIRKLHNPNRSVYYEDFIDLVRFGEEPNMQKLKTFLKNGHFEIRIQDTKELTIEDIVIPIIARNKLLDGGVKTAQELLDIVNNPKGKEMLQEIYNLNKWSIRDIHFRLASIGYYEYVID